nr:hypothetical protein [Bartonella taylorii]
MGSYTPDWAVLEREGEQKLYFAHFAALEMGSSVVLSVLCSKQRMSFQVRRWLLQNDWCMKYLIWARGGEQSFLYQNNKLTKGSYKVAIMCTSY